MTRIRHRKSLPLALTALAILLSLCLAPTTARAAGKMYWIQLDTLTGVETVHRANLDGSEPELILEVVPPIPEPLAIALDLVGEKIYWTGDGKVSRGNLDGSGTEVIIASGSGDSSITVDSINAKIYYSAAQGVQRANLDGSGIENPTFGLGNPRGIALDLASGKMYWGDTSRGTIFQANLDGSSRVELSGLFSSPTVIGLDLGERKLYRYDFFPINGIARSDLDGSNLELAIAATPSGSALDSPRGKIYWATLSTIQRANLDGTLVENLLSAPANTSFKGLVLDLLSALEFRVSDSSNGDPILDAEVHVERQDVPTGFDAEFLRIDSNGDAVYTLDFLEPGSYRVTANAPGFLVSTPFIVALGITEILSTPIQLVPDPTFTEGSSIALTILSTGAGDALLTNSITVTDNDTTLPFTTFETVFKDGSMLLLGFPEGSFDITATDTAFSFTTELVTLGTAERDLVTIDGDNNVTPGTIRGDVLDSNAANAPLGGAKVFADSSNSDVVVEVESSNVLAVLGEYAATDVVPGTVTVTALTADRKTTSVPVEGIVVALTSGGLVSNVDLNIPVPEDDSDGDGLPDLWEIEHNLDPNDPSGDNGKDGDPDGDGLTNEQELDEGTIPTNTQGQTDGFDTDGDGFSDGFEVAHNSSPLDGDETPLLDPADPVWVAFDFQGPLFAGTRFKPFKLLSDAVALAPAGATIRIKGNTDQSSSSEAPLLIPGPLRIEADGGTIRVGVSP